MIRRIVVVAAILAAGLAVRAFADGAFAKYAGVALYAALIYALVHAVAPRLHPLTVAAIALAFCWAIEFAQLTSIPAELSSRNPLARLVFGTTFNTPDLFWYAVGVAVPAALHWMVQVRRTG